jgi:hypothetical protein
LLLAAAQALMGYALIPAALIAVHQHLVEAQTYLHFNEVNVL